MNECLFRGKRKDNGAWVEGNLITSEKDDAETYIGYLFDVRNGVIEDFDIVEVIPETVGMWTGLTDKNGIRVFEGDIVRSDNYIGVVKLGYYTADGVKHIGFYTKWVSGVNYKHIRRDLVYWVQGNNAVVIGNIHDNPELLEGEA